MFETITASLDEVFKKLRSKGQLTEANIKEGMREIRMALLEADVNFKVVRDFVKHCTERAVGPFLWREPPIQRISGSVGASS